MINLLKSAELCLKIISSIRFSHTFSSTLSSAFVSSKFLQMLAYLTDIFSRLKWIQKSNISIVIVHEKLAAFKAKIPLCIAKGSLCIAKGSLALFLFLEEVVGTYQSLLSDVATAIHAHPQQLLNAFDEYLSAGNLEHSNRWIRNPFLFQVCVTSADDSLKGESIGIQQDDTVK